MEIVIVAGMVLVGAIILGARRSANKESGRQLAIANFNSALASEFTNLQVADKTASLTVLDPSAHDYRPLGKERLLAVHRDAAKMELRSTGRVARAGMSYSIPIMKGVRYRVYSGKVAAEKKLQPTAFGRIILTDKAFVFEGSEKNERITWSQIADCEVMIDGYKLFKRTGSPKIFAVANHDHRFAAVLLAVLNREE